MVVHEGYDSLLLKNPVVTLGIFDGVHLGHKAILDRLVSEANAAGGESVVITFSPHPRLVLDPDNTKLSFLTSMEEKKALLEKTKVEHLVIIEFNTSFSNIGACDFINDILIKKFRTRHIIIGYNHHFGRRGEGDFNTIKKCTESVDFKVEQVEGLNSEEGTISSSVIREALLKGRLEEANRCLGYSYSITGIVVEGRQIGRLIGFPTANIKPVFKHKLIPSNGVYAVEIQIDGLLYQGMMNIGTNPTVNDDENQRTIEVNIFDFDRSIYGNTITVIFRKRLRDEIKFADAHQLTEQMYLDKQQVMNLLK